MQMTRNTSSITGLKQPNLIRNLLMAMYSQIDFQNLSGSEEATMPDDSAEQGSFYLQDSRNYVGNAMLWWAKDDRGYTTDLTNAETYSKEVALYKHSARPSDIPWPKAYIDGKTQRTVDMQYVKRSEAIAQ